MRIAVCYMHEGYVAHRDIKAQNVVLDDSRNSAKLCDFGISTLAARAASRLEPSRNRFSVTPGS